MKRLLFLILTISFLSSCNRKKAEVTQSDFKPKTELKLDTKLELTKDTIRNYWALILDTVYNKKEFKIANIKHTLELKTYSLNDSSIVRNLSQNKNQIYLDHSHKKVTDFELLTDSIVDKKSVDKTHFEKYLIPEFYAECNLFSTEIDSIVSDNIYLNSDLAIPDTDNQWRVWYSIKISNNRLGKLETNKTDYVGL